MRGPPGLCLRGPPGLCLRGPPGLCSALEKVARQGRQVAGTHRQAQVSRAEHALEDRNQLVARLRVLNVLSAVRGAYGVRHQPPADPGQGLFTRCVDTGDHDQVGTLERIGEVTEQRCRPGVAVWLEHRNHASPGPVASRRQGGADLAGVVRVVVDVGNPIGLSAELVPAPNSGVSRQRSSGVIGLSAHLERHRDRRRCVEHVVQARHGELEAAEASAEGAQLEARAQCGELDCRDLVVGTIEAAIGGDPGNCPGECRCTRVVGAHDPDAGRLLDKLAERCGDGGLVAVIVKMVGLYVGDDDAFCAQPEKGPVGLVRLDHKPFAAPPARASAPTGQLAPDEEAGLKAALNQDGGKHCRRCRLTVRAAHRQSPARTADSSEHLRSCQRRYPSPPGFDELDVAWAHSCRKGDDVRSVDV